MRRFHRFHAPKSLTPREARLPVFPHPAHKIANLECKSMIESEVVETLMTRGIIVECLPIQIDVIEEWHETHSTVPADYMRSSGFAKFQQGVRHRGIERRHSAGTETNFDMHLIGKVVTGIVLRCRNPPSVF